MKFSAWFSIVIGLGMIGQWSFFILANAVPELQTEPIQIAFHLAAEGVTAIGLLVSGIGLLRKTNWAKNLALLSSGMLFYTSIVSPGYFAQLGQFPLVGMFVVIIILNLISLFRLLKTH
jgi:hypothetical protein